MGGARRPSGPRRGRKRKVSLLDDVLVSEETLVQPGEKLEEQTTTELEASGETPLSHCSTESEQRAQVHDHTATDEKPEAPASTCGPAGEEAPSVAGREKRRGRRGRRSSSSTAVLQQLCEEVKAEEESSSSSQEVEAGLAPWQTDFCFEDVFKPVAPRGQRSVRRSLRNQDLTEQDGEATGLAWLPHVPSESRPERGRSSRGRRPSAQV